MDSKVIDLHKLYGRGIGYVDEQLLASKRLMPRVRSWTRETRLAAAALDLGCAAPGLKLREARR